MNTLIAWGKFLFAGYVIYMTGWLFGLVAGMLMAIIIIHISSTD